MSNKKDIVVGLSKHHSFILALVFIIGFLLFYYIALINACVIKSDTSGIQIVASTLGPIVASIIGYYFGQRPLQPIADEARNARNEKENYKQFSSETFEGLKNLEVTIEKLERENEKKDELLMMKDDVINTLKSQKGA